MTLTDQSSGKSSMIAEQQSNKALSNGREDQTGSHDAVDELIQKSQLLPTGHPHRDRAATLHGLASALSKRYESSGSAADLEESIRLFTEALELRPAGHPDRADMLSNFARGLRRRYECSGSLGDLDESIRLSTEALKLCPTGHPRRAITVHSLARALDCRYERSGYSGDLEESIRLYTEALELRPAGNPDRVFTLHNLAWALSERKVISSLIPQTTLTNAFDCSPRHLNSVQRAILTEPAH